MTWLTEESELIAKNWETVADIIRTKERLESELSNLLVSVEAELKKLEWWEAGWDFYPYSPEVYIANRRWKSSDRDDTIWLGVEEFDAEHIFGLAVPPNLYVWVWPDYEDLVEILAEEIGKAGYRVNPNGLYLVSEDVQKCLPEMVDKYPDVVRKRITNFFDKHAKLLMEFDGTIKRYFKKYKQKSG